MATEINIYIGAPNDTHKHTKQTKEKIIKCASMSFDSYSLQHANGAYLGQYEQTITIKIIDEREIQDIDMQNINEFMQDIKRELKQESVLITLTKLESVKFE